MVRRVLVVCGILASSVSAAPAASGQMLTEATLGAGTFRTANGPGPVATVKVGRRLIGNVLLGDLNAAYATSLESVSLGSPSERTHVGMLDLQAQLQLPLRHVQPYAGAGIGWVRYLSARPAMEKTKPSASASVGLRVSATRSMLIRVDYRFREWRDPADAGFWRDTRELTVGVGWHW